MKKKRKKHQDYNKQRTKQSNIGNKEMFMVRDTIYISYQDSFWESNSYNSYFKFSRDFKFFITVRILIYNFGPIEDAVLMLHLSVYGIL